jgi:small subunit ribosomal protein S27Ae
MAENKKGAGGGGGAGAKEKKGKAPRKPYKQGRQCPKCNSGMAEHSDRFSCGKCGYTEFKQKKS